MFKVIAIYRDERFSPNSVGKDAAILQAVCGLLQSDDILYIKESELSADVHADIYVSMGRLPQTLVILKAKQESGALVINSAYGIENCERGRLDAIMRNYSIPVPPVDGTDGFWLKRTDAAAQSKDDVVFCKDRATLASAEADFVIRGVTAWIVQAHIPGDLIKWYAVSGGFFRYYYPGDDGISKFGDEKINGKACHYDFDVTSLQNSAAAVAEIAGVDVYGGDAIVTPDGKYYIIDFNDWPSFSRCRDAAAEAIAATIKHRISK